MVNSQNLYAVAARGCRLLVQSDSIVLVEISGATTVAAAKRGVSCLFDRPELAVSLTAAAAQAQSPCVGTTEQRLCSPT